MIRKFAFVLAVTGLMLATASQGEPVARRQPTSSAVASEGVATPAGRVPMQSQAQPPEPTAQQHQLLRHRLGRVNLPGPPLKTESGARLALPSVAETPAPKVTGSGPESAAANPAPQAAGDFAYFRQTTQSYGGNIATVAEPSVGNAGSVVFYSGNWFASYSTDGGQSFSFVDPVTQFPNLDGGFCCDQTVTYDRGHDQVIWQLLYLYSSSTKKGSYRTAFAPSSAIGSGNWCYYDWSPQSFGQASGLWLDYPEVALSTNYVWYSANVFNASGAWKGTVIWRIPLAAAASCSVLNFNYYFSADHFTFTLAQGASSTMYFFSNNSTSSVRAYHWDESSTSVSWNDVAVANWSDAGRVCTAPDGQNWCARSDGDHGRTAWLANGICGSVSSCVGLMWSAAQDGSHPYPYIDVARFDPNDNMALIDQPIIWSSSVAWNYPGAGVDARGHIAGTVFWGGGGYYPTLANFIDDDFDATPPPWEVYSVAASAKSAGNWGDYYHGRVHGTNAYNWVATGQSRLSDGTVEAWYLWFGRQRDATSLTAGKTGSGTVAGPASGSYTPGSTVSLTETPSAGWTFAGWSGACTGTASTCTFTIGGTQSVTANFAQGLPTLSVSLLGPGTVTSSPAGINCPGTCSAAFANGTQVNLNESPANGWAFGGWTGACGGFAGCPVMMNANESVTATFWTDTSN